MATGSEPGVQLEIGHVLFMDVVGYSKLLLDDQRELQQQLNDIVRSTEQVRLADAAGKLVRLPTGDGMALVFFNSPEAPVQCAVEISKLVRDNPQFQLRMGIHSGPVNKINDVNDRDNIAGAGINIAQRVMDCADAGHILLSKRTAEDLSQSRPWRPFLHDIGECSVKHGVPISLVNLYTDQVGNPAMPEKVKLAQAEKAPVKPASKARRIVIWGMATVGSLVAVGIGAWFFWQSSRPVSDNSIAVLPFENFSDDKENAFFADGIQDDILTSLARIQGLRVISRTSVMPYRGGKESHNLREISKALKVTNVLEGSVRRSGDRIVVTVQLIDARDDRHIWANRYDRTLADSLGLQGELAEEIADALRVTLSPDEKARVEHKPTENTEAYLIYLQASQIEHNPDTLLEDYRKAEQLYRKAIDLDPKFALAHARLGSTCAEIYHFYEPIAAYAKQAREQAEIALNLQSNLSEAYFALGQCALWVDQDYDKALEHFKTAGNLSPNNADVVALIAAIKRRQGRWEEALQAYEKSQSIDPQNANTVRNLVFTNTSMRRWPQAAEWATKMRAMAPASLVAKIQSGYVDFMWKGETRLLKALLSDVPAGTDPDGTVTSCRWEVAMIERDFTGARAILEGSSATEIGYLSGSPNPKSCLIGLTYLAEGDTSRAATYFAEAQPVFEAAMKEAPQNADRHANLGWFYAFAGRKDEAIREARKAVELKPESKDALDGAIMNSYLALVYARVGEADLAIQLIERLLKTPGAVDSTNYSITVNDLKHRWEWDPIRNDRRFQKLIAQ
ncbi:MAG TPA: tetratricopeptide repeat protein [Chthoniobacterales bacterium]|nr:tetratricopeptide repeat protein [Chthoniobacterales bacterium]